MTTLLAVATLFLGSFVMCHKVSPISAGCGSIFLPDQHHALIGHSFLAQTGTGRIQCMMLCWRHSRCLSFNHDDTSGTCQLNRARKEEFPESYKPDSRLSYFGASHNRHGGAFKTTEDKTTTLSREPPTTSPENVVPTSTTAATTSTTAPTASTTAETKSSGTAPTAFTTAPTAPTTALTTSTTAETTSRTAETTSSATAPNPSTTATTTATIAATTATVAPTTSSATAPNASTSATTTATTDAETTTTTVATTATNAATTATIAATTATTAATTAKTAATTAKTAATTSTTAASTFKVCSTPFGMKSGAIADHQITANNALNNDYTNYGSTLARFNGSSSWCGKLVSTTWIQVDLGRTVDLYCIIVQGRRGGNEHVDHFSLRYSDNGVTWTNVEDNDGAIKRHFSNGSGNEDVTVPVESSPSVGMIRCRFIRIRPSGWQYGKCMRFELIGCD